MRVGGQRDARSDAEFTEYVMARVAELRRLAYLLCQDWHLADDLVQDTITRLYARWWRVRTVEHVEAYARTVLVRQFLTERRSGWVRRVTIGPVPDRPGPGADHEAALDLRAALTGLPPRQRATLVLRFYCDLTIDQTAGMLGCSPGTVKSQTAKGLDGLRRALEPTTLPVGAGHAAHPHGPAESGQAGKGSDFGHG
jgi:RNA polymerase sigma-70 factor (sigma-E family)